MSHAGLWWHALPTLLLMLLLGSGITLTLWRGEERISIWEWLAWSWLAGTGLGSMLLGVLGLFLSGGALAGAMALLAGASAVAGWRFAGGHRRVQLWPAAGDGWEKALIAIPLGLSLFAFREALAHRLLADGLFIWEFKAHTAFLSGGHLPLAGFTDVSLLTTHPRYPLLLPLSELWLYLNRGAADQMLAKTLFPGFFAAAIFLLHGTVARCTGRLWLGALAAALSLGVPELLIGSSTLENGYADYPLAALFLAAAAGLVLPAGSRSLGGQLPLSALAAGLLPWTKQDGLLLWVVFATSAFLALGPHRWKTSALVALPGALVWLGWQAILRLLHALPEEVFQSLNRGTLAVAAHRVWPVVSYFGHELANLVPWGLLWWAWPVAAAAGWVAEKQRPRILWAAGLALGALLLDVVPYLFTRLDLAFHLQTSCSRLVLQSAWVALLAVSLALTAPFTRRL